MKKIAIITSTRAEYGLLRPVYIELKKYKDFDTKLIVTGTHLSKKFGYTYKEIINDKINIYKKISILDSGSIDVSKIFSKTLTNFYKIFLEEKFSAIVVLGDRYEMLAIATAALLSNTPICHLYGGETTEGAIDEAIRHSITKMSNIHFTSTEIYRKRVIQLGENPKRVFNYGAIGIENILKTKLLSKNELSKYLKINLDKYFVVTYHPVTLDNENNLFEFENMIKVLLTYKGYQIIFTKANADKGGDKINFMIDELKNKYKNIFVVSSLGTLCYLSLVKYSVCVVGNSSSGITEVPALCVPCVNIGDRQKGRLKPKGIIDTDGKYKNIKEAIDQSLKNKFKSDYKDNPFYKNNTSKNIAKKIADYVINDKFNLKKKFFDINCI